VTDRLSIGILGAGKMGSLHARVVRLHVDGADVVAVADIDEQTAKARAGDIGARACSSEEMLADPGVAAVVIATPPRMHCKLIAASAKAGKHIFCEKPIGWELLEIDDALAAADAAGVKLQIGFNRRFDANFARAREVIAAGKVGRVLSAFIVGRDPVDQRPRGREDDDLFLDTTIHDLDMARFLLGAEATSVYAQAGVMAEERFDDPDTALTTVRFKNRATAVIDNNRLSAHGYDQRVEVCGTKGMLTVGNEATDTVSLAAGRGVRGSAPEPFFSERYFGSYVREMQSFVDCVLSDGEPDVSGADGRTAVELALACARSYREGRPIALAD
jgi:myo-inositol 2-dehydrogenase/D-chiro-inositol 1-dehydrogenase